jgi:hypothetical protein
MVASIFEGVGLVWTSCTLLHSAVKINFRSRGRGSFDFAQDRSAPHDQLTYFYQSIGFLPMGAHMADRAVDFFF